MLGGIQRTASRPCAMRWRNETVPAVLAALVLCVFSADANASAVSREQILGPDSATLQRAVNIESMSEQFSSGVARSTMLAKIDRSTVEVAAESLSLRLGRVEDSLHRMLRPGAAAAPITGVASSYNPFKRGYREGGSETASGETYNPEAWTAAIQMDLRSAFGGVRYRRNYRPAFALVIAGEKYAIIRINDVGPLLPGRVIDLNARAMRYFANGSEQALLPEVRIRPLSGERWQVGPFEGGPAIGMAGDFASDRTH